MPVVLMHADCHISVSLLMHTHCKGEILQLPYTRLNLDAATPRCRLQEFLALLSLAEPKLGKKQRQII